MSPILSLGSKYLQKIKEFVLIEQLFSNKDSSTTKNVASEVVEGKFCLFTRLKGSKVSVQGVVFGFKKEPS